MDKNQANPDLSCPKEAPPELGGKRRYCMRCGKRFATHITLGSRGIRQYRCDECFEGKKRS